MKTEKNKTNAETSMRTKTGYQWDSEVDSPFVTSLIILAIAAVVMFLTSCGTTRVIEEHHYHESSVDSMAVESIVDGRLQSWHQDVSEEVFKAVSSYTSERNSEEQEQEKITEITTSYVDSLGREVKEQQKITERSMSRQWQMREAEIKEEFRQQLQEAIERYDSVQQEKYKGMKAHWEKKDSTNKETVKVNEGMSGTLKKFCIVIWGVISFLMVLLAVYTAVMAVKDARKKK